MDSQEVLRQLREAGDFLSGQELSRRLGVSRAAVWKMVEALRRQGARIESRPRRGYRLEAAPAAVDPDRLREMTARRRHDAPVIWLDEVDSTNNHLKRLAPALETGTAVLAARQTEGRGRRGRRFLSPAGQGLYLSVLLRPVCPLPQVGMLTAWTAVALRRGIRRACGLEVDIKWPNDLVVRGRKLGGILTELEAEAETGLPAWVIVGIGLNLSQREEDFGPELARTAVSLAQLQGAVPDAAALAGEILLELDALALCFPGEKQAYLSEYRGACLTLGRQVDVIGPGGVRRGTALGVEEDFSLRVRWEDGTESAVSSGEVSVRGVCGYT